MGGALGASAGEGGGGLSSVTTVSGEDLYSLPGDVRRRFAALQTIAHFFKNIYLHESLHTECINKFASVVVRFHSSQGNG